MRKVVTIDGLAGSGKTSIAKLLASKLNFVHLNSGILYRVYGYLGVLNKIDPKDINAVNIMIKNNHVALDLNQNGEPVALLNNSPVTADLQLPEVSEMTSRLSALDDVRAALLDAQRNAFPAHSLVAEGRDMGTVVFPNANIKFFIQVSVSERVRRRLSQLIEKEPNLTQDRLNTLKKQMEIEIIERDERDQNRNIAPTKPADDALIVLNEGQTLTAVVENMYATGAKAGLI